jgi:uncharacterized protein (DUF1778 family)
MADVSKSKTDVLCVRIPREHRDTIVNAARQQGRSLSNYFVTAGLAVARALPIEPQAA